MKNSENGSSNRIKARSFLFMTVAMFMALNSYSQSVANFEIVKPLTEKNTKSGSSDLYSLYYDNNPSLIVSAEKSVSSDSKSANRVLEISVSNLNLLSEKSFNLSSIELIRVIYNQSDKVSALDLSKISNLSNLKAIVFQCDFNCSPSQIEKLISSKTGNNIPIYYLVSIPQ